ncbi:hypothetical protein VTK73DRAFT_58 [Phialemonium thermophilum]|uniref:Uncharacterized protein n=1 Tax=Phialemonium thermophilum TaxID=223376 RepID=A0ABR3Y7S6_9PEZI
MDGSAPLGTGGPSSGTVAYDQDDSLFRKFDNYPWVKDRQFLQGLAATLGALVPSADMIRATATCLQARIWWFQSRVGHTIDPAAYAVYLARHSDAPRPDVNVLARIEEVQLRLGVTRAGGSAVPSWQIYAPKADLRIKATDGVASGHADDESLGTGGGSADEDAPYPEQFRAIIEAVTLGKEVSGIKEIPNIVVRQPGISPVGKLHPPRKPWEKRKELTGEGYNTSSLSVKEVHEEQTEVTSSSLLKDTLDLDFPPVQDETVDEAEQGKPSNNRLTVPNS